MAPSPCSVSALLAAAAMAASGAAAAAGGGRELAQTAAAPTSGTAAEGDLRLVSQVIANGFTTGALQVFHDGQFGAVCNVGFDAVDAAVACRQLGFQAGGFALPSLSPTGSVTPVAPEAQVPFVLENVGCSGGEARLIDCPAADDDADYRSFYRDYSYSGASSTCDPFGASYAFVACGSGAQPGGPEEGDLRLTGGVAAESGAAFGRLEVFTTGGWGTVCGGLGSASSRRFFFFGGPRPTFTEASADVACQQLGFQEGVLTATPGFVSDTLRAVPIVSAGASCGGSEDFLADCPGFSIGNDTDTCGHVNDVSLICFNGPDPAMDGMLRLMGGAAGPGYEYGRLEVFLRGFWSSVCNVDGFTPDSATVACRALGFGGGASLEFFQPFARSQSNVLDALLPVGLAAVDCAGNETSLLACSSDDTDVESCSATGSNTVDATVLACGTSEPGCGQTPPEMEGSVRLVGGFGTLCDPLHTGIVEVFHFGEWGALCFDNRGDDMLVADVVCRQLGFLHGTPVDPTNADVDANDYSFFGFGAPESAEEESELPQERFWLSEASCRGPEDRLVDCDLGIGFRTNNRGCSGRVTRFRAACRQFAVSAALEDVATPGAVEGDVRLVNETAIANWQVGRLEVFFQGSWSQVCRESFDGPDADVACRQLGYGAGSVSATGTATGEVQPVYPEVAVTLPACNGTESSLLECSLEDASFGFSSGSRGCFEDSDAGLLLACVAEPLPGGEEGSVRITSIEEKGNVTVGVPEVFHAGAWGTICEGSDAANPFSDYGAQEISEASAAILCRQLGFQDGIFEPLATAAGQTNMTLSPPWLSSLGCAGTEPTLAGCDNGAFGSVSTCGPTQQLICTAGTGVPRGTARLVGGSAAPSGAWAYGRLEVFDGLAFSGITEFRFSGGLGRNAAVVACRSLGFEDGVEIITNSGSALPGPAGDVATIDGISCVGDEATLGDCDIELATFPDYGPDAESRKVSLLCSTPSGCPAETSPPAEGDVRLVPLINATSESAPCDAVHQGVVQYFSDGVWNLICTSTFSGEPTTGFDIDAKVICGQLGFPFSTRFDPANSGDSSQDQYDYDYNFFGAPAPALDDVPVFATRVSCTGKESRLDECFFPEQDSSAFAPSPVGFFDSRCTGSQRSRLAVACRQFPVPESDVIRR